MKIIKFTIHRNVEKIERATLNINNRFPKQNNNEREKKNKESFNGIFEKEKIKIKGDKRNEN